MTDLLKLAEAYYTVARDLEARSAAMYDMGKNLFQIADHLCEQNIREQAARPCKIMEYDGAFKCATHGKQWGAITPVDEPCAGWVKP